MPHIEGHEEEKKRPTSFAQARAVMGMEGIESKSLLEDFAKSIEEQTQDAIDAAAKESEDKSFWGNFLTLGTTIACVALDLGTAGGCTVMGALAGIGTRIGVDAAGDAEGAVPAFTEAPDAKYYRKQGAELEDALEQNIADLEEFHANEWMTDLTMQMTDSWNAYRMASMGEGIWGAGKEVTKTGTGSIDSLWENMWENTKLPEGTNIEDILVT